MKPLRRRGSARLTTVCAVWLLAACYSAPGARDRQSNTLHQAPAASAQPASTKQANATPPAQPEKPVMPALGPTADPSAATVTRAATTPEPIFDQAAAVLALPASHSTSLGAPGHGSLVGGVALPDAGPGFVHNPKRPDGARFGTVELVQDIVKAAAVVQRDQPGMELVVNDLGLREGGPIRQHGSHQNGRDADILFYVLDAKRQPLRSVGVPLDPDGEGFDFKDVSVADDDQPVRLDVQRTWRFVQALLETAGDSLQRIFIVEHIRTMLLAHAERIHAPPAIRARFADVTCQPVSPHDDHMHVRLFCAPDDIAQGCFEMPPIYPWQRAAMAALGLTPMLEHVTNARQRSEEIAERTTSPQAARKRTGPMNAKVRRWLARRAVWIKQPRPGRQYCR